MARTKALHVNGTTRRIDVDSARSLLSVLRDELDLTGSKYGCGEGQCGACIVLIDGQPLPSCITPIDSAAGKQIVTIEGVAHQGTLHPIQQAFIGRGAMQCGYCTPGMIMAALGLLRQNPHPSEEEVAGFMHNNLCRCGVYPRIVRAIRQAAAVMAGSVLPAAQEASGTEQGSRT